MKTATGLAVIAIGAILALAVHAHTPGININLAGVILMLVGVAGVLLRSRTSGWLRRRIVVRPDRVRRRRSYTTERSGAHLVEDPATIVDDPALLAAEVLNGGQAGADDPATIG
jgi:hypothetical protein